MEKYLEEEETNILYDTCMFDEITEGYLISVLEEMEMPVDEIKRAIDILRFDFTDLDAHAVRCIRKGFLESAGIEDKEDPVRKEGKHNDSRADTQK